MDLSDFPRGDPHRPERSNIAPNATWLSPDKVSQSAHWRFESGKIFVGQSNSTLLGIRDDRHLITIAGSRAGKGVSAIIPNLLLYPGSVLCVDPKGENAAITAKKRNALGQTVFVLDPFETSGLPGSSFNPLAMIDIESDTCVDDAALIADALLIQDGGEGHHWTAAARNWVRGLILYVVAHEKPENQHLVQVRDLLTLSGEAMLNLLDKMIVSEAAFGAIARAGRAMEQKAVREASAIISTAIEQTDFLDSPAMRRVLVKSDFRLIDLKRDKITVYLCLPAGRMATHHRWLRIFINLVIEAMERDSAPPDDHPVLVMMDEFPVLGHLESIEKAAGLIAGFGVRLWPIIQDLSQLKRHYKESWETFMGNVCLVQLFGNTDLTTLKYASERLGQTSVTNVNKGEISVGQATGGFSGESYSQSVVPLMTPEEIGRFFSRQSKRQLLLWSGVNPIAAERVAYFEHPYFEGMFDRRSG